MLFYRTERLFVHKFAKMRMGIFFSQGIDKKVYNTSFARYNIRA